MSAHFDLKRSGAQFMFNLKAANGEIVLTSERYTIKSSAKTGIAAVQANALYDGRYQRQTSSSGLAYFTLMASNGEVVGTSELYSSVAARDAGIEVVKTIGPTAVTVDNT